MFSISGEFETSQADVDLKALESFLVGNRPLERLEALLDAHHLTRLRGRGVEACIRRGGDRDLHAMRCVEQYRLLEGSSKTASFTISRRRRLDNLARSSLIPHYLHGWLLRLPITSVTAITSAGERWSKRKSGSSLILWGRRNTQAMPIVSVTEVIEVIGYQLWRGCSGRISPVEGFFNSHWLPHGRLGRGSSGCPPA
jgi:hypothetical protein